MTRPPGPVRLCRGCGRHRPHWGRGLCRACWDADRRARFGRYEPNTGNPGGRGIPTAPDAVASRIEEYAYIRPHTRNRREAAARVGISYRTASRYEARLKEASNA